MQPMALALLCALAACNLAVHGMCTPFWAAGVALGAYLQADWNGIAVGGRLPAGPCTPTQGLTTQTPCGPARRSSSCSKVGSLFRVSAPPACWRQGRCIAGQGCWEAVPRPHRRRCFLPGLCRCAGIHAQLSKGQPRPDRRGVPCLGPSPEMVRGEGVCGGGVEMPGARPRRAASGRSDSSP